MDKKIEAIHSGQGSINDVVAKADETVSLSHKMGFYQQANFGIQLWQLFYRQNLVYLRNPIMSTSRFLAGIVTALFFGGAFWMLPRNTSGFLSRENQAFAYMLMVPGYGEYSIRRRGSLKRSADDFDYALLGSAVVAYWVEKRKAYYHEEAAGYYHRLAHLLVMFFVEWIFVSAVMVRFKCIQTR